MPRSLRSGGTLPAAMAVAAVLAGSPATAQFVVPSAAGDTPQPSAGVGTLVELGGLAEERIRLRQLTGRSGSEGYLLRSPSTLTDGPPDEQRITALAVGLKTVWNSTLPFSLNEGSMWAGRGYSAQIGAGFRIDLDHLSLILAPQITHQENRDFQTFPFNRSWGAGRDPFSSPWYDRPVSIDLPSRFGGDAYSTVDLGQSSLTLRWGPVATGAATENLWWGPGIRNALVLSNNAPGVPHLFLRTASPIGTPLGDFEARWILGRLTESDFFDQAPANDVRSLSAVAVTLRPRIERELTVGVARGVYAPTRGGVPAAAAFDAFRDVGRPNARAGGDLLYEPAADQLFSVFARWLFPASGFEAYAEWARYEQPASLRDLLLLPHHSRSYTVGMQWARPVLGEGFLRLQAEASDLGPSSTYRQRNVIPWYTSRVVRQGYTHRGRVLGAAIGPGASSQWLGADLFHGERTRVGLFGGRIRWDDNAFYSLPGIAFVGHDVTLWAGLRVAYRIVGVDIAAEYATQARLNYLYQNTSPDIDTVEAVDLRNQSFRLILTPTW